ncbi:MAG: CBS domain-containing protein [Nostoc sp. LLA-1]|nr:CBS domain-containing protein [Cyanocohniella sp. LLY]
MKNTEFYPLCFNIPNLDHIIDRCPLIVAPDTPVLDAIDLMNQSNGSSNRELSLNSPLDLTGLNQKRFSCVLVMQGLQLAGIFTERDVVRLSAAEIDLSQLKIADVMTSQVITIKQSHTRDVLTVLSLLRQHRIRHLPVVDEQNQLIGLLTPVSISQILQPANLLKWRCVTEVMTSQVIHAFPTASVLNVARLMVEHGVSCVVIAQKTEQAENLAVAPIIPVGIITEQDIVQFQILGMNLAQTEAKKVMSTPLFCLSPSDSLLVAHQEMQQRRIQRLVIVGKSGELLGIVTPTSFLQVFDPLELSSVIGMLQERVEKQTTKLQTNNQVLQHEVEQRQQTEEMLRQATDELEIRVEERTGSLAHANALLQQEICDRQQAESALQQQIEQQQLLSVIAQRIRASLNLNEVLNTTVTEVRQFLGTDRVFMYQFHPDFSGTVVVESVQEGWISALNAQVADTYFMETGGEEYRQGRFQVVEDIYQAGLAPCHCDLLAQFQVRANLAVPILQGQHLWGLLVANQCAVPRRWQQCEIDLLKQLATQVGIAIQQSELYQQVQADLIERQHAEQKIREQAALLDIATDAIFVRDLENRILFWSQGSERLYGWTAEESLGKKVHELFYRDSHSQLEVGLDATIAEGSWSGELEQITKTGKKIIVASRWTLVRDEFGQPQSVLVVNTDITEKKQLEAQFLRTQRLESLGTLASGIAHDLNNILTPILSSSQILTIKLPYLDTQNQRLLKMIEDNSKRAADLVKQILTFARGSEGRRFPLQIRDLLLEIEQILNSTFPKSIKISTKIPTQNIGMILADATQIHQVFMNLCVNARDAMPQGGILHICAENFFVDENFAKMNLNAQVGPYVVITISDTGFGISPLILDRIFEPFFTTKEPSKGTGLGLSTVIGIVKNHGGFVNVSSQVGKGTQFHVYLPAIAHSTEQAAENLELPKGSQELILVVDDEGAILDITKTSLEDYNYRVMTASNGIEAISVYAQHQNEISVVLMDMMMPSMDGLTAIRILKQMQPQVKIIGISGITVNSQIVEATAAGVNIFLRKPYTLGELLQTLNQVFQET